MTAADDRAPKKRPFLRLSAELTDGEHWTIGPDSRDDFLRMIGEWWDEFHEETGESFTVEVVEMTQEEVDALPSI